MGGFSKDNSYGDLIYTNEDTNIEKERQYFWEAFPAMSLVRGGVLAFSLGRRVDGR